MGWREAGGQESEIESVRERERQRVESAYMLTEDTEQKEPDEGLWFRNFILLKS